MVRRYCSTCCCSFFRLVVRIPLKLLIASKATRTIRKVNPNIRKKRMRRNSHPAHSLEAYKTVYYFAVVALFACIGYLLNSTMRIVQTFVVPSAAITLNLRSCDQSSGVPRSALPSTGVIRAAVETVTCPHSLLVET